MRYIDELQCAAARIVTAVRERARQRNVTYNPQGAFDTFHIRRGDFQYKATRIDAQQIYENVQDVLTEGSTVYVATDEHKKSFFDPLKEHYDIVFMGDFMDQLQGVNKNHYGMIDQLVASRGRIFFGCWHSTYVSHRSCLFVLGSRSACAGGCCGINCLYTLLTLSSQ
jgi:GDP-fucose protein O-fucosyltransferase